MIFWYLLGTRILHCIRRFAIYKNTRLNTTLYKTIVIVAPLNKQKKMTEVKSLNQIKATRLSEQMFHFLPNSIS